LLSRPDTMKEIIIYFVIQRIVYHGPDVCIGAMAQKESSNYESKSAPHLFLLFLHSLSFASFYLFFSSPCL
jgi:hypothetical protein